LEADAAQEEAKTVGRTFTLTDPEPWPDAVKGIEVIGETIGLLRRYVVMTESDATAVALWISLTYLDQHVDTLPILAVTSPEKRCGKTTLLTIISKLARKALPAANVSPAALFRAIEKFGPTLVIDEGDTFLKDNEELRGILNAGHTREFAFVLRSNPDSLEPERFSTWAPKAIACIGKLPETLSDRSVEIRLQRRSHKETAEKLRDADPETFTRLQRMAFRWGLDKGDEVKRARPSIPQVLNDRACDNWHPLLAIAAVAGFDGVPNMAVRLSIGQSDQESIKVLVLTTLRDLFKEVGDGFLSTDAIIERFNQDKEAPWAGWKNGMTAEKLGKILKSYSVKSEQRQESGERRRGYSLKALQPVFDRYLAPVTFLTPENGSQPVHLPADQVLEPIHDCTASKNNPCSAQDDDPTRAPADQVLEPIREEMHRLKPKIAFGEPNGNTPSNGYDDDSDEETVLAPENGYGTRPRTKGRD
jgi:putative DNA primase/helicase